MMFPTDWYWVADDGRVFSSARAKVVSESDAAFKAFNESQIPTIWPRDDAGAQTEVALDEVLLPYRLSLSGPLPAKLSSLQFMDLFTEAEQAVIATAAMNDVPTKLWYDRAVAAKYIDLSDDRIAAGVQALVDAKLLTATRRNRVLKGLPPA